MAKSVYCTEGVIRHEDVSHSRVAKSRNCTEMIFRTLRVNCNLHENKIEASGTITVRVVDTGPCICSGYSRPFK